MNQILETVNVTMKFAGLIAVDSVNIKQKEGEILALIGPNGAGKTTLFNMLTGVYRPTEGEIFYRGENITGLKPFQLVRKGIARTFQNIRLFKEMTTLENLLVASPNCKDEKIIEAVFGGKDLRKKRGLVVEQCEAILGILKLQEQLEELACNLPYGKQRLLEIGRALATGANYLLLDEPGAGMNSLEKEELAQVLRYITEKLGKNILLIEHDMRFVMGISDRIVVLDHAFIVYGFLLKTIGKMNPMDFFKGILPAQMVAFSTCSSSATLPVSFECVQEMGVSKEVSSFVLPLGATINMDGTALYQGVCALFVAQIYGIDLSLGQYVTIILTGTLASIGTAGVPGAGLIMLTMILQAVGLPLEGAALVAGIDRILDMPRTTVNITGDATVALIVDKGEKDREARLANS